MITAIKTGTVIVVVVVIEAAVRHRIRHPSFLGLHFLPVHEQRGRERIPKLHRDSFFTTERTESTEENSQLNRRVFFSVLSVLSVVDFRFRGFGEPFTISSVPVGSGMRA